MTAYDEEKYHDSDSTGNDSPGHAHSDSEPSGRDNGQIILIVLVVLAIIASIVMLIASSTAALKIALLAALWAAVGGIFLVTRYRNQVRDREEELYVREDLYHAELEKLRAQQTTSRALERLENSSDIDMDVLAEIKAELASIREQLEELSGREFTYEPAALKAEARRIMEIEARAHAAEFQAAEREAQNHAAEHAGATYTSDYGSVADMPVEEEVEFTQASGGKPSADAIAGRIGSQPTYSRNDNPLAEFINEMSSEAASPREPEKAPKTESAKKQAADSQKDSKPKEFNTGSFQAVRWDAGGDEAAKRASKHSTPEDDGGRGRRRSDEQREGKVTVAELLAAAKKRNKDS